VKGKAGKHAVPAGNLTKDEFAVALSEITEIMHAKYNMVTGRSGKVAFDCPRNHALSKLQYTSCNLGVNDVVRPPRYSGDFMQCIEHVHAIVCAEFQRQRFRQGRAPFDVDADGAHLKEVFFSKVTAAGVRANCEKVMRLVSHVAEQGHGGYAISKLT
jgi:hypothetical protein